MELFFDTIPTQAQEVFDITGAGDTAIACLAIGLCLNLSAHNAQDSRRRGARALHEKG